jgi:hypothetical protein
LGSAPEPGDIVTEMHRGKRGFERDRRPAARGWRGAIIEAAHSDASRGASRWPTREGEADAIVAFAAAGGFLSWGSIGYGLDQKNCDAR